MIPALIVPVLNRYDHLDRMLESIQSEDIGRIVVIDNGGLMDRGPQEVIRAGWNLGVAASWNLGIKATPEAPWWAVVNSDIVFSPGDLDLLTQYMEGCSGAAVGRLRGLSAFGVNRAAIAEVGWFDENFHPAYYEDNDFDRRARLAGIQTSDLPSGLTHVGSQTIGSDDAYRRGNYRTFPINAAYYRRKWGGLPGEETFATPFNEGGDLRSWRLDVNRLADQSWKKE